jgi:ethanolamine utilization protein EutN
MFLATVRGTVVSTRKDDRLVGFPLLVVEQLNEGGADSTSGLAVDTVGAGVGETVLVVRGQAARIAANKPDAPIDAAIVGIVDTVEIEGS